MLLYAPQPLIFSLVCGVDLICAQAISSNALDQRKQSTHWHRSGEPDRRSNRLLFVSRVDTIEQ